MAELEELEDQIQRQQQAKWFAYDRRSLGMSDEQKISLAREILAQPPYGLMQRWGEHVAYHRRHPTKSELDLLVEELQKDHVRWLCYRRRSLGMKTTAEKIEIAKKLIEMAPFSRAQGEFERLWEKRNAAGEPGAT